MEDEKLIDSVLINVGILPVRMWLMCDFWTIKISDFVPNGGMDKAPTKNEIF